MRGQAANGAGVFPISRRSRQLCAAAGVSQRRAVELATSAAASKPAPSLPMDPHRSAARRMAVHTRKTMPPPIDFTRWPPESIVYCREAGRSSSRACRRRWAAQRALFQRLRQQEPLAVRGDTLPGGRISSSSRRVWNSGLGTPSLRLAAPESTGTDIILASAPR